MRETPGEKERKEIRAALLTDLRGLIGGLAPGVAAGWLEKAAVRKISILLSGPTGSGKTRLAEHLMATGATRGAIVWGKRQALNLAAVAPGLAEFQLFGSAGSQYPGDRPHPRKGIIEIADQSALFLDEVHLAPRSVQAQLLRVIETHKVRRIGDDRERDAQVWFIAASSAPGKMLRELAYRMAGTHFAVTALADRSDGIVALAKALLMKWLKELRKVPNADTPGRSPKMPSIAFAPSAEDDLRRGEWPGNVRQLDSLMMRVALIVNYDPRTITLDHVTRARMVELDETLFLPAGRRRASRRENEQSTSLIWQSDDDFVAWFEKGLWHSSEVALPTEDLCKAVLAHTYVKRFGSYRAAAKILGVKTDTTVRDAKKAYEERKRDKFSGHATRTRARRGNADTGGTR